MMMKEILKINSHREFMVLVFEAAYSNKLKHRQKRKMYCGGRA